MYKRGINSIELVKNMNFYLSSGKMAYLSMGGTLDIRRPYNGMYIKNSKIYVSNVTEKIEVGPNTYNIAEFILDKTTIFWSIFMNVI